MKFTIPAILLAACLSSAAPAAPSATPTSSSPNLYPSPSPRAGSSISPQNPLVPTVVNATYALTFDYTMSLALAAHGVISVIFIPEPQVKNNPDVQDFVTVDKQGLTRATYNFTYVATNNQTVVGVSLGGYCGYPPYFIDPVCIHLFTLGRISFVRVK